MLVLVKFFCKIVLRAYSYIGIQRSHSVAKQHHFSKLLPRMNSNAQQASKTNVDYKTLHQPFVTE